MRGTSMDPSDPSHSTSSSSSSAAHYYLAVDRLHFKMETLVDLLEVAGKQPSLPIVICCSSRDELDAVCSAVANLSYISFSPLESSQTPEFISPAVLHYAVHSVSCWTVSSSCQHGSRDDPTADTVNCTMHDQAETERASILEKFRMATLQWNQKYSTLSLDGRELEQASRKSCMVVATDACLPSSALGEASLTARLLINYELPTKKETYFRRISSCLGADGIVINMVVGGEVAVLRALEETSGLIITEMPISISEIL